MRQTGENYNPFPDIRSPNVFLTFQVLSTSITKNQINANPDTAAKIGKAVDTINGASMLAAKYATLEKYGWPLDGSCSVLPNSGAETGFWPNRLTGADGNFETPVTLMFALPKPVHTLGWTFHFDEPTRIYSPEVRAVCYDADNNQIDDYTGVLESDALPENGWRLTRSVTQYKKVAFTFYGLNEPYRYMRLVEVDFGLSRTFTKDTIGSLNIKHELALDGDALPAKKLTFTFDNADKEFNVLNPIDVYQYWRNGQSVSASIKIGDESVSMGTYFISRAEIGENYLTAKVTAYDEVNQLGSQTFYPAALAESETVTLRQAVEKVLEGYTMGVNLNGLDDEPVSLRIKDTHTKRAVLHYLAQAVRAAVWIDRDDTVQIKRLEVKSSQDAELTADALYNWSGVSVGEEVTGVTLMVERELEEEATSETYSAGPGVHLYKQSDMESGVWNYTTKAVNAQRLRAKAMIPVTAGTKCYYTNPTQDVYFGNPKTQTSGSTDFQTSLWKTPGGANAVWTIVQDGYLTFNVRKNPSANIEVSEYNNIVAVVAPELTESDTDTSVSYSNPCVAPGYGWAVADWLLAVNNMAKLYAVKNRCDPAVEIGDTLKIADVFANDDRAIVTGLDVTYDGTLYAVTKAQGEFDAG